MPEVFAYVTDLAELPVWMTHVVSVAQEGDGPVGVGARLREVRRLPGGIEIESLIEVSEYEPDSRLGVRIVEGPASADAVIAFEHLDGGTRLFCTAHSDLGGVVRLAQPLLEVAIRHRLKQYCKNLKRVLEEQPAAT